MIPLVRFLVAYAAALAVAAAVGKLVPHVRWIASTYDASLALAGLAISAVMLTGAAIGPLYGWIVDRFGAKRITLAGLVLAAIVAALEPFVGSYGGLFAVRTAEGVGYSLAIVGATVVVVETSTLRRRMLALGVFSSFAPIGFALGQWAAGYADPADPLPAIAWGHAGLIAIVAIVFALAIPADSAAPATRRAFDWRALVHPPALRSAIAFGCATGVLLGAVALAPIVLAAANGIAVADAARYAALAALPGITGRFAVGWLLGREGMRPITLVLGAGAVGAVALGAALDARVPLAGALAGIAVFQICVGAMPGVMSALIPHVARSAAELGTVAGLVNQMIQVGNLIGPPLALGAYAAGGVPLAFAALAAVLVAAALLVGSLAVYRHPIVNA